MYVHKMAQQPIRCLRVLVPAIALFFLLPVEWSWGAPKDISAKFTEFVVKDGKWQAIFLLRNNTRDRVVTHIDYRGEYVRDGKKKTFRKKSDVKLKLNKPLQPGKTLRLRLHLSVPATSLVENITLTVTRYTYRKITKKSESSGDQLGKKLAATVQDYLGSKYVWGGTSPAGFDCSGLVRYVCRKHGVSIPRTSAEQAKSGVFVAKEHLRPGDLVFFGRKSSGPVDHVGIYIGNDTYVHAPNPEYPVMKTRLSDNSFTRNGTRHVFQGVYVTARRVTP